jgi:expansin (peptidoglycan-binding protein)
LIATAGAVVAGTATVAVVVQTSSAACAAGTTGKATYYQADGSGNCSFDPVSNPMVVALGNGEYRAGAACGGYLDVTGPKGTVRVKVTDRCPECAAGHLDLSKPAFARIGEVNAGVISVTYRSVTNPAVPGPMTVRVKEGSSRYWLALRLDNTGNPLSTVELRAGDGWKALSHTDYNYWIAQSGAGTGPFTVRVTDTAGRRTTLNGVALTPGAVQRPGAAGSGSTPVAPRSTPGSTPGSTVTAVAPGPAAPSGPAPSPSELAASTTGTAKPGLAQPRCG